MKRFAEKVAKELSKGAEKVERAAYRASTHEQRNESNISESKLLRSIVTLAKLSFDSLPSTDHAEYLPSLKALTANAIVELRKVANLPALDLDAKRLEFSRLAEQIRNRPNQDNPGGAESDCKSWRAQQNILEAEITVLIATIAAALPPMAVAGAPLQVPGRRFGI